MASGDIKIFKENGASTYDESLLTMGIIPVTSNVNLGTYELLAGGAVFKGVTANDTAPLGSELLSSSGWTSTNWTGSWAGGWDHTTGNTSVLSNTLAAVVSNKYQISFTVTGRTAGTFNLTFGGQSLTTQSVTDTWGPTASSTGAFSITPTTDFDGAIVLSIKVISASTSLIDYKSSDDTIIRETRYSIGIPGNQFDGVQSGQYNTTGTNNTGFGYLVLSKVTTGYSNTGVGREALRDVTTGYYNMGLGNLSGTSITTGHRNIGVGTGSIFTVTTGSYNTGIGYNAVRNNITGSYNIGIGYHTLINATASYNTSVGADSLSSLTNASGNTGIGHLAGKFISDGSTANLTASNSIYIGYSARPLADAETNQVVIGYDAIGNGSDTVTIGNTSTLRTYLTGVNLKAGTATAGTAPIKLTAGTHLSTTEAGALEFNGTHLYFTVTNGGSRYQLDQQSAGAGITIGSSVITGGTTGRILYDNAGVVGEMTTTGSGTVVALATSPTFTTSIITPLVIGGTSTTQDLTFQTTSGVGATGADMHFLVGNAGGTEALTILNSGYIGVNTNAPNQMFTIKTTAAQEAATLSGTELVNGTGWTSTGWTGTYPSFTHNTGNTSPLYKTVTLSTFSNYQVSWTVTGRTAGGFTVGLNGQIAKSISSVYSTTGVASFRTGASATGDLIFTPGTTFDGTILDISVQLVNAITVSPFAIYDSTNSNSFEIRPTAVADKNLFGGYQSGRYNTIGGNNLGFGYTALANNITGQYNLAIGANTMAANTCGEYNTSVGANSLNKNTTGYFNTALGGYALNANTEGAFNVALGSRSLFTNTTGSTNIAIGGYSTLSGNTIGDYNIGLGNYAVYSNISSDYNVGIGGNSLYSITGGSNVAIGYNSGRYLSDGTTANVTTATSMYLGVSTKASADGVGNETVLGYNAIGVGSNSVSLGNSSVTKLAVGATEVFYQPLKSGSAGTATQVLTSNGPSSAPTWQTVTGGSGLSFAQAYAITTLNI